MGAQKQFGRLSRRAVLAGVVGSAAAGAIGAGAQAAYPSRPVRVIVPYPPGGGADTTARLIYPGLSAALGTPVVIENRGGAAGAIGAQAVAKADADGYTLLHDASAFSINPSLFPQLPYDARRDFVPVFIVATVPFLLLVNPQVKASTVQEFIAQAKQSGKTLNGATSGPGSAPHLSLELFRRATGIDIAAVSYRGGGPALNDVMGGHIPFTFGNASSAVGHVRGGALRALGHTGSGRLAVLPEVPPLADVLPGFEVPEWNAVLAPAGTPPEIVARLNAELNKVTAEPAVVERLTALAAQPRQNSAEDAARFIHGEMDRWGKVIREADIKPN